MKAFQFVPIVLLAIFLSCNKSVEPLNVPTYPFTAGKVWNYRAEESLFNFHPTQVGVTFRDTSFIWSATVKARGDSLLHDTVATSKVTVSESLPELQPSENYYLLRNDTLYLYAWLSGNGDPILPKKSPPYRFLYKNYAYRDGQELYQSIGGRIYSTPTTSAESLYYSSSPPSIFVFPLRVGASWIVTSLAGITKKVIGTESITTESGIFSTYIIEWSRSTDSTLTEKEYLSDKGLIKRTFVVRGLIVASSTFPEGFGTIDLKLEYVLTSLHNP